jgi:peptidoglycan/LPS O-acetylase OafA/YrhL
MFSKTNYRKDIQVLRGLAVLAVVLFHAKESYFPLGYLGVDVFFVISGFVVTPLILRIFNEQDIERGRLSNLISNLKAFYIRRFYRLAPALAVTLSISALAIFLLGSPLDHQRFARQGIATLLLVGNLGAYRYSGNYFSPAPNPLVHTWSLSVEEQIYIFLPLILMLFLLKRRNIKKVATIAFLSITGISILSFLNPTFLQPIYSRVGLSLTSLFSFYSPIDRIWQFALGGIGYLFLDKYRSPVKKFSKPLNLFFLFGMLMILFAPLTVSLKFSSILASFIAVGIIISRSIDVLPEFITRKLEWLGDRSYSIYLVHMPLLYLAKISPVTSLGNSERRYIQTSVAVVASIALGSLSYSRIENRFRGRSKYGNHRVKNKLVVGLLTFVVPLFFFSNYRHGRKASILGTGKKYSTTGLRRLFRSQLLTSFKPGTTLHIFKTECHQDSSFDR